jgi:hypothetical protein
MAIVLDCLSYNASATITLENTSTHTTIMVCPKLPGAKPSTKSIHHTWKGAQPLEVGCKLACGRNFTFSAVHYLQNEQKY